MTLHGAVHEALDAMPGMLKLAVSRFGRNNLHLRSNGRVASCTACILLEYVP